jgi:hypothetical protein
MALKKKVKALKNTKHYKHIVLSITFLPSDGLFWAEPVLSLICLTVGKILVASSLKASTCSCQKHMQTSDGAAALSQDWTP